jgi:serine protease Do
VRRLVVAALAVLLTAVAVDARPWGWLGVRIRDLSEHEMDEISARHGLREGFGVMVVEVIEGTPAARAGLQRGDLVVAFGERPVTETRLLQRLIAAAPLDAETRLTVLRPEGRQVVPVRLVAMPPDVAGERVANELGFALRDTTMLADPGARGPGSAAPTVGIVGEATPAERAGLRAGDVLVEIGDRRVLTRDAAREALAAMPLDRPLQLGIRRDEEHLSLTIAPRSN